MLGLRGDDRSEQGGVLYQTALGLTCLLVFVGLVVDGGLMLANYRRAQLTADTAAQAGSHAVSVEVFWGSNAVVLAAEAAEQRAMWVVEQNGTAILPGGGTRPLLRDVQVVCGANWIQVTGEARLPTFFMRMFGIPEVRIPVKSIAYPAFGIEFEGQ
jgi:uncharacterized membrane protein